MKMHLTFKGRALCNQYAKRKLRTTNIQKMQDCKKCKRIAGKKA